ncbi:AAA family ATPase [Pseudomonas alliivorans]|uniref:AAA family ATPase n=1 Tax=Pseudomonas alliivorans TaxID=2810613 RepID=A0ABS4C3R5_9PSED|nr:AAA family ATPase [Pseudomonas alliivorans]MBP0945002.1 AAA family ATPase [Pseudomonas alliivorans]MEE4324550.1 AAA family ATPase [Pseudomonas alliivorans]MEE4333409.1 AAA family ATPase [Pseudomonas alliivorans]MEE4366080.1 AAA family ATPase [Pseudomonas alliivorans]
MSQLNSITLSNLRKFGSDVTIELSPGATILLAPNGTGKTTVFEAIEFGLTGKIARLQDIEHVIRDEEAFAQVSLNFADLTATAKVTSDGTVVQDGNLTALFPGVPEGDVPFLLRLTHLLDQRESDWIVQAADTQAGSQLAKLPLGREGSRARAALPSVRRALKDNKSREEEVLRDFERELNDWNRLIQERDVASAGAVGALRPRDHLAAAIANAATRTQSLEQIPPGLLSEPVNQDSLALAHSALLDVLRTKVERTQALIVGLAEADGLVVSFGTVRSRLDTLSIQLVAALEQLNNHATLRSSNLALQQEHQKHIALAQEELLGVANNLERLVNQDGARNHLDQRNRALTEAATLVSDIERRFVMLREKHERNLQVRNQHAQLDAQLQSLNETEKRLRDGERLVVEWEAIERQLQESRDQADGFEGALALAGGVLTEKRAAHESCKAAEAAARAHFQALSASADAIRQAVALIAEHLPLGQDNCPLCLYPHGAAELQIRVAQALQAINPSLTLADQQLRVAAEALAVSGGELASALAAVRDWQTRLTDLNNVLDALDRKTAQFRIDPILASDSVSLAKETLRVQFDSVVASRKSVTERRSGLEPSVPQDVFEYAQHTYEGAAVELDQARVQHIEAVSRRDQALATLSSLVSGSAVTHTLEDLTVQKSQIDAQISELKGRVDALQTTLAAQEDNHAVLNNECRSTEEAINHAQSQLATFRAAWQRLGLSGDPLTEAIQARASTLKSTLADVQSHLAAMENLGVEVSAWAKLNESQLAQRLLDAQRLGRTEEEFATHLNNSIALARSSLSQLSQLSDAMDTLEDSLKKEIDNVQKHVSKVVPRWQSLLKRVVRESRFHEASLNFFTYYNKERAEVLVPLGGKSAPVPDVASEAQLTDLQLTFLLSMAMSHQWSPWKALLLDDPTQHHDLVHASAVFDLLRDYIVDHRFQVVIATHDALQARYFLRKLQNDGIDAKIWTLVPTEDGVTAEEGQSVHRSRIASSPRSE